MSRSQPKGLRLLFLTELWERFGFYMIQTILVLYLSKQLGYSDEASYLLYGAFSSLLYLTPVLGGYLADRYLGYRQSILLGGVLFFLGYLLMAIPRESFLFLGLSIVILGNGFFKPNVSSLVGDLYTSEDPRRDGGFTLFYMGINIGSLIPPLFAGALVAHYSYGAGFFVAALGMAIALGTFLFGRSLLEKAGSVPSTSPLLRSKAFRNCFYFLLLLGIGITVGFLHLLLYHPKETNLLLIIASLGILGAVLFYLFKELPEQRKKMIACLILIVISVGFWAVYNQTFTSLMLFADRNMNPEWLGFHIDAEFTQFFNPFFILVLSPVFSWLWLKMEETRWRVNTAWKFSLGIAFMALGFFVLGWGVLFFHVEGQASASWLVLSYFLQTIGELLISPIGLAMVTRLAPRHLVGMMMGVWFLTQSAAFAIGGGLATFSDVPKEMSAEASLVVYAKAFFLYGAISAGLALFSFSLIPFLNRLIGSTEGPIITPKR